MYHPAGKSPHKGGKIEGVPSTIVEFIITMRAIACGCEFGCSTLYS